MKRQDIAVWSPARFGFSRAAVGSAAAVMAVLTAMILTGCAATATGTATATGAGAGAGHTTTPAASATRRARPVPSPVPRPAPRPTPVSVPVPSALPVGSPNAGSLPQTQVLPATGDTSFRNVIHDLWLAVTTGNPDYARPAFFPEKAYEQVKAIADPDYDWQYRLWYDFTLDIAALRPLVGAQAKLLRVDVPVQYVLWVPPGACYNNAGYWHVPGSRVMYEQGGVTRSFGIASLISWRGNWYLIHLGALSRSAPVGLVDDPEAGPGAPGPPGGC